MKNLNSIPTANYILGEGLDDMRSIAISNISQKSRKLWAPALIMWIFTGICFVIIRKQYREILEMRLQMMGSGEGPVIRTLKCAVGKIERIFTLNFDF